jgi:hypothetical protein
MLSANDGSGVPVETHGATASRNGHQPYPLPELVKVPDIKGHFVLALGADTTRRANDVGSPV